MKKRLLVLHLVSFLVAANAKHKHHALVDHFQLLYQQFDEVTALIRSTSPPVQGSKGDNEEFASRVRRTGVVSPSDAGPLGSCQQELQDINDEIASCIAGSEGYLFVQMGNQCCLHREDDGSVTLRSRFLNEETVAFTSKPYQYEGYLLTSDFIAGFEEAFGDVKPNAAVTFVHKDDGKFEGPLVATFQSAAYYNETGEFVYAIEQSEEQAAVIALDVFFEPDSVNEIFVDCTYFIDPLVNVAGYQFVRNPFDP